MLRDQVVIDREPIDKVPILVVQSTGSGHHVMRVRHQDFAEHHVFTDVSAVALSKLS